MHSRPTPGILEPESPTSPPFAADDVSAATLRSPPIEFLTPEIVVFAWAGRARAARTNLESASYLYPSHDQSFFHKPRYVTRCLPSDVTLFALATNSVDREGPFFFSVKCQRSLSLRILLAVRRKIFSK